MNVLNPLLLLSTGNLSQQPADEFPAGNVLIDIIPFIESTMRTDKGVKTFVEELGRQDATVVFTSSVAVKAVAHFLRGAARWKIYCLDEITRSEVDKHFTAAAILGTATSASGLAELIVKDSRTTAVTFFCGNMRRDELPNNLSRHGITVNEFQVYDTIKKALRIDKHYHGILFFSPSAVDAFFMTNTIADDTILFAMGHSTAEAIVAHSKNRMVIADRPNKRLLLKQAAEYFLTQDTKSDVG